MACTGHLRLGTMGFEINKIVFTKEYLRNYT
jgi:hypothetical protein